MSIEMEEADKVVRKPVLDNMVSVHMERWEDKMDKKLLEDITDIVDRAIIFATFAHKNARRKSSALPYIIHPLEAGAIAASMTEDRKVIAAAILHDVVEDTEYTQEDIGELFGQDVMKLNMADTENKRSDLPPAETWKIRKQETIDYLLKKATYKEKIIVLSDKLSNMRSIYNEHSAIGDKIWEKFNQKDKLQQKWYYESILNVLNELEDTNAYKEYQQLVQSVFQ